VSEREKNGVKKRRIGKEEVTGGREVCSFEERGLKEDQKERAYGEKRGTYMITKPQKLGTREMRKGGGPLLS